MSASSNVRSQLSAARYSATQYGLIRDCFRDAMAVLDGFTPSDATRAFWEDLFRLVESSMESLTAAIYQEQENAKVQQRKLYETASPIAVRKADEMLRENDTDPTANFIRSVKLVKDAANGFLGLAEARDLVYAVQGYRTMQEQENARNDEFTRELIGEPYRKEFKSLSEKIQHGNPRKELWGIEGDLTPLQNCTCETCDEKRKEIATELQFDAFNPPPRKEFTAKEIDLSDYPNAEEKARLDSVEWPS